MKAEEFFQSKMGGKSSKQATKYGELITPIYTVILMNEYAQQVREQYAHQQAMAYEEWLCEIGATKTISSRPDYMDFIEQQKPK